MGEHEPFIQLRIVNINPTSVHAPATTQDISIYRPIVDDFEDRMNFGLASADRKLFHIWGGAIDVNGDVATTEATLDKAKVPGGGVLYYGTLLPLLDYQRGFPYGSIVMEYFLITEGIRSVR